MYLAEPSGPSMARHQLERLVDNKSKEAIDGHWKPVVDVLQKV